MTRTERDILRAYWRSIYHRVRVRANGTVECQERAGGSWGVVERPDSARRSAAVLLQREREARAALRRGEDDAP